MIDAGQKDQRPSSAILADRFDLADQWSDNGQVVQIIRPLAICILEFANVIVWKKMMVMVMHQEDIIEQASVMFFWFSLFFRTLIFLNIIVEMIVRDYELCICRSDDRQPSVWLCTR